MFNKVNSDLLPTYRKAVDYKIKLNPGRTIKKLRYSPLYKISLKKAKAYRKYIIENLSKSFIESSYTL